MLDQIFAPAFNQIQIYHTFEWISIFVWNFIFSRSSEFESWDFAFLRAITPSCTLSILNIRLRSPLSTFERNRLIYMRSHSSEIDYFPMCLFITLGFHPSQMSATTLELHGEISRNPQWLLANGVVCMFLLQTIFLRVCQFLLNIFRYNILFLVKIEKNQRKFDLKY